MRNDLPPEAEAPVIEVESKDSEFAAMYLSFYSQDLDQNQITDYLTRVVQPRLSSIPGVQRADILGGRVFAMRIWPESRRLASLNPTPAEVHTQRCRQQLSCRRRQDKENSMIAVNLREHRSEDSGRISQFGHSPAKRHCSPGDVADIVLARNGDDDVRFSGQKATFMG